MYSIEVQTIFSAAHALRLPLGGGGGQEPLHGHNFTVTVKIAADRLDPLETVIDFHIIETAVHDLVAPWKNRCLNDLEPFRTAVNPSAERIAEEIGRQMQRILAGLAGSAARNLRVLEVRVTEAPNCAAIWSPATA